MHMYNVLLTPCSVLALKPVLKHGKSFGNLAYRRTAHSQDRISSNIENIQADRNSESHNDILT